MFIYYSATDKFCSFFISSHNDVILLLKPKICEWNMRMLVNKNDVFNMYFLTLLVYLFYVIGKYIGRLFFVIFIDNILFCMLICIHCVVILYDLLSWAFSVNLSLCAYFIVIIIFWKISIYIILIYIQICSFLILN